MKYSPPVSELLKLTGSCRGIGSVGLELNSSIDPKVRASVESVVCFHLIDAVRSVLAKQDLRLLDTYGIQYLTQQNHTPTVTLLLDIEMKVQVCLSVMEVEGFGVSRKALSDFSNLLKKQQSDLENHAFFLAGKRFSMTSSKDVAKAVGIYRGRKVSTSKQVLERNENPISKIVLQWRKLNCILTKMVYPLLRMVENDRIHGSCITHSATGRITMHEPNLQNVARDFEIVNPVLKETVLISCRSSFFCKENHILLSADYCQLELRLLAHLSQDLLLCSVMRSKEDVFKSIAAKWNNISERQVLEYYFIFKIVIFF